MSARDVVAVLVEARVEVILARHKQELLQARPDVRQPMGRVDEEFRHKLVTYATAAVQQAIDHELEAVERELLAFPFQRSTE